METLRHLLEPLRRAGHLFFVYWPALLMWALLGGVLFRITMQVAVLANGWKAVPAAVQSVFALALVALAILIKIGTTITMFFALRDGMPGLRHLRMMQRETDRLIAATTRQAPPEPGGPPRPQRGKHARRKGEPDERQAPPAQFGPVLEDDQEPGFVDFLIVAAVPFLALYVTWGFIQQYLDQLTYAAFQRLDGVPFLGANLVYGFAIAGVVAYLLKRLFWWREEQQGRGRRIWRALAIYFETTYLFFAIYGIATITSKLPDWWHSRVFWVEFSQWWDGLAVSFPPFGWVQSGFGWLTGMLGEFQNSLLVPVIWLAITAVVYGHVLDREREVVAQSRFLQSFEGRLQKLPGEVRFLVDNYTGDSRGKWVPMVNALRLLWRAGPMLVLVYTVAYLGLHIAVRWGFIGITYLIGPQDTVFWIPLVQLMADLPPFVIGVLQVCLLAAVFDTILMRHSQQPRAELRPEPVPSAPPGWRDPRAGQYGPAPVRGPVRAPGGPSVSAPPRPMPVSPPPAGPWHPPAPERAPRSGPTDRV